MKSRMPKWSAEWTAILAVVLWTLVYFIVRRALDVLALEKPVQIALTLLPMLPFALFLAAYISTLTRMDELHRRVQLEALAIAFPLALLLLMLLGLIELVIPLSPDDWSYRHVWAYLPLFYFFGLAIAWRKYK